MTQGIFGPTESWLMGLATSMVTEHDYMARVEGELPRGLNGSLYRNGPGRFDLGGVRKNHLLDGDGMIQAFDFQQGKVRYRNCFVHTKKYVAEQRAGKLTFPTWSTRAPGGIWRNAGNRIQSQAGVTVFHKQNRLYAFDEVGQPYGLDDDSLQTLGEQAIGPPNLALNYKAHTKTDAHTGNWAMLAVQHGLRTEIHLVEHDKQGVFKRHQRIHSPRGAYIHDWFLTERYALIMLHPLELSLPGYLAGMRSFTQSLRWKPQDGNLLVLVDRTAAEKPRLLEAPASFMWHSLNAYELGDTIVADFVGYEAPDHFIGEQAAFRQIMQGRRGLAQHPGLFRRYVISLKSGRVHEEILSSSNCDFPMVDPQLVCRHHREGYATTASEPTVFHHGLIRIDTDTGHTQAINMGNRTHLGEPIFVSDPQAKDGRGWLLSLGLDADTTHSFLGVFNSHALADGPVARVWLHHATPLSFHGCWRPA